MYRDMFASPAAVLLLSLSLAGALGQAPPQPPGIMDANEIHRILVGSPGRPGGSDGVLLDLNLMRLQPSTLDDPEFLKYFIALNNCANPQIGAELASEFEFPKLSAFYKDKAATILSAVPTTIRLDLGSLALGQYDPIRKAFPILNGGWTAPGAPRQLGFFTDHVEPFPTRTDLVVCIPANRFSSNKPIYQIKFDALKFTEVPVDEAVAKDFVLKSSDRHLQLIVDIEILPQKPNLMTAPHRPWAVGLNGKVTKVVAVTRQGQELSVLVP